MKYRGGKPSMGSQWAMRVGMEIVASAVIGLGIGYALDRHFGTQPWFLLLFFMFGAGAGFLNLYHVLRLDEQRSRHRDGREHE